MRQILLALGLLATSAVVAAAAPPAKDIKADLNVFLNGSDNYVLAAHRAEETFKQMYPNVTIHYQYVSVPNWSDYINQAENQIAAGNSPDLFEIAIEGMEAVASKGLLLDLKPLISADTGSKAILDDIAPNLMQKLVSAKTGQQNYFPMEWNSVYMIYNKDMFDAAHLDYPKDDWTWDDFRKDAKALTIAGGGNTTQYGYAVPGFSFGLAPWFLNNDTNTLTKDWSKSNVADPKYIETLKFLHDLINVDKVAPAYQDGVQDNLFAAKHVAMFSAGHWVMPEIQEAGLEHVGIAMMPRNKAPTNQTVFGFGGIGIMKTTKNPDLAWEFIKVFAGEGFQKADHDAWQAEPVSRKWATMPDFLRFVGHSDLLYKVADIATPVQAPPAYAQIDEIFSRYFGAYMNNNADLDSTVSGMDSEISRAISRTH